MPRYYKVRLPKRIASDAKKRRQRTEVLEFDGLGEDPGVSFRVSDLDGGQVPTESTIDDLHPQRADVGLSDSEAAEVLASMAIAERASMPDRLPLVVALVVALLFVVMATGVVQSVVTDVREQMIEDRIKRPRAQYGWSARVGATKKALGLPEVPAEKIDYIPLPTRFFPSFR